MFGGLICFWGLIFMFCDVWIFACWLCCRLLVGGLIVRCDLMVI